MFSCSRPQDAEPTGTWLLGRAHKILKNFPDGHRANSGKIAGVFMRLFSPQRGRARKGPGWDLEAHHQTERRMSTFPFARIGEVFVERFLGLEVARHTEDAIAIIVAPNAIVSQSPDDVLRPHSRSTRPDCRVLDAATRNRRPKTRHFDGETREGIPVSGRQRFFLPFGALAKEQRRQLCSMASDCQGFMDVPPRHAPTATRTPPASNRRSVPRRPSPKRRRRPPQPASHRPPRFPTSPTAFPPPPRRSPPPAAASPPPRVKRQRVSGI